MGWMIMATHGFNDGRHWLSNGLSHVWCHAIICHAMYLSIWVWETNQSQLNLNTWVKIFVFSEYIGYCGLQNVHYKILLTIIPFNWYFCSVIWILMLLYMVYVNMGAIPIPIPIPFIQFLFNSNSWNWNWNWYQFQFRNWPQPCNIDSKVVNLVILPIVKGLILAHFPLPRVWF